MSPKLPYIDNKLKKNDLDELAQTCKNAISFYLKAEERVSEETKEMDASRGMLSLTLFLLYIYHCMNAPKKEKND